MSKTNKDVTYEVSFAIYKMCQSLSGSFSFLFFPLQKNSVHIYSMKQCLETIIDERVRTISFEISLSTQSVIPMKGTDSSVRNFESLVLILMSNLDLYF